MAALNIEGQVAQVLNERELAINRGSAHGVKVGMFFAVLAKTPIEIRDPETEEVLGRYDQPKTRVRVTRTEPSYSICRTYKYRTYGGGFFTAQNALADVFGPRRVVYETLDASKEAFPAPLSEEDSYVEIGDRVQQIEEDEVS